MSLKKSSRLWRSLVRDGNALTRSRNGAAAIIFGLLAVPAIVAVGGAIDFGRIAQFRSRMQQAADNAALEVGAHPELSQAARQQIAQQTVLNNFGQNSINISVQETDVPSSQSIAGGWKISVSALPKTSFIKLVGIPTIPVTVTSQSSSTMLAASGMPVTDINFHIIVDASQSMGVGADQADRNGMSSSQLQCSYACHSAVAANTTPTDACRGPQKNAQILDGVDFAHGNNFKLRIDVVKQALTTFMSKIASKAQSSGQNIKVALYTFASNFTTVQSLTTNYSIINSAISNIDIAGDNGGTSLQTSLQQVASQLGTTGDGSNSAGPLTYVIIISDGLYDNANNLGAGYAQNANSGSGGSQSDDGSSRYGFGGDNHINGSRSQSYNGLFGNDSNEGNKFGYSFDANGNILTGDQGNADHWSVTQAISGNLCYPSAASSKPLGTMPFIPPTGSALAPPCIPDPINGGNFELAPIDPAWCSALKKTGANISTVYTTYILDNANPASPSDPQYSDRRVYYIQTYPGFMVSLKQNMAACASSSKLAYQATTSADILSSINSLASSTLSTPLHLVK